MKRNMNWVITVAACLLGLAAIPVTSWAQNGTTSAKPTIREVSPNDPDYVFLRLGLDKDYLAAERWRIIDQIEHAIPAIYEPRLPFH